MHDFWVGGGATGSGPGSAPGGHILGGLGGGGLLLVEICPVGVDWALAVAQNRNATAKVISDRILVGCLEYGWWKRIRMTSMSMYEIVD